MAVSQNNGWHSAQVDWSSVGTSVTIVSTPQAAQSPRRILVVDDEKVIRRLNSETLIRSGYLVDTAEDGAQGWKMLHAVRNDPNCYDLLITDNSMPNLSGIDLIKKLRSAQMSLPVIIASGTTPANLAQLNRAALLSKPYSLDQLVQMVKSVLHPTDSDPDQV